MPEAATRSSSTSASRTAERPFWAPPAPCESTTSGCGVDQQDRNRSWGSPGRGCWARSPPGPALTASAVRQPSEVLDLRPRGRSRSPCAASRTPQLGPARQGVRGRRPDPRGPRSCRRRSATARTSVMMYRLLGIVAVSYVAGQSKGTPPVAMSRQRWRSTPAEAPAAACLLLDPRRNNPATASSTRTVASECVYGRGVPAVSTSASSRSLGR
jgi:hypothetical protein